MKRTPLCMAAIALLFSASALAQTTGGTGQAGSGQTSQPGQAGSTDWGDSSTQRPGESGTMGGTAQPGAQDSMDQDALGQDSMDQGSMEQGSTMDQSAMEGSSGQGQNFAAFDQNQDGSLDRVEFARAVQVMGSAPAAGGEAGVPSQQTMRGDRAISPLNQSTMEFQRADTNGDGKISQEEFSNFSPQQ